MYKVLLSRRAAKYYGKVPKGVAKRLVECFENLEKDPFCLNTKALIGFFEGKRRYRVGDIRVVYEVDQKNKKVNVTAILPRGDVYKKLFLF